MKTVKKLLETKGTEVLSIHSKSMIYDALVLMAEKHVGALLVIDDGKLVGVFSERDYAREVVLKGRSSKTTAIAEVMSSNVITVTPNQLVHECMSLMSGKRIRHLPVVEHGKVVGVLSIGDLVKETIAYQAFLIDQLESYIVG